MQVITLSSIVSNLVNTIPSIIRGGLEFPDIDASDIIEALNLLS